MTFEWTSLQALRRAMFFISGLCSQRTLDKPGAVIERLSPEAREALSKLKSSDIDGSSGSERIDDLKYLAVSKEYVENKELEKEKFKFDEKILK
jgi:hypothetical protein